MTDLPQTPADVLALLDEAKGIIETGDQRLLAADGTPSGLPPDLSLTEWRRLYVCIKDAAAAIGPVRGKYYDRAKAGLIMLTDQPQTPQTEAGKALLSEHGHKFNSSAHMAKHILAIEAEAYKRAALDGREAHELVCPLAEVWPDAGRSHY